MSRCHCELTIESITSVLVIKYFKSSGVTLDLIRCNLTWTFVNLLHPSDPGSTDREDRRFLSIDVIECAASGGRRPLSSSRSCCIESGRIGNEAAAAAA